MWKDIEGYVGLYQINENGEIKGKKGMLKCSIGKNGYKYVALCKNSKHTTFTIHRLLATHFLEKVDGKNIVDHIDRNRLNNDLKNLRFVNYSENNLNSKRIINKKGCICHTKDKRGDKVYDYYRFYYYTNGVRITKRFKCREDAEKYRDLIMIDQNPDN